MDIFIKREIVERVSIDATCKVNCVTDDNGVCSCDELLNAISDKVYVLDYENLDELPVFDTVWNWGFTAEEAQYN